jgi:glycosyltransferase involved in cell wall biosynthesis
MANQTRQLAEFLARDGIGVHLVRTNEPYRPHWVGRVRGVRALARLLAYLVKLWRAAGAIDVMHVMANSGWSWHLVAAPAVWLCVLRRVPVVVNYRGGGADGFLNRAERIVRPTLARVQALAVPSGFLQEIFGRRGLKATIIPNIVDLERFSRREPRALFRAGLHVVVTRNLEPIYDIETAVHAFSLVHRQYPSASMSVAGSGPSYARLVELVKELELDSAVRFTGALDNARIAELLATADVLLNPSRVDNMPISLLEGLAAGVAVVSTSVGGVRYVVEHERTALLVPVGDAQAMADAILRLHDDPALVCRLTDQGWQHVQQFAWENVRVRLLDLYRAAMAAGRHGRPQHEGAR